MPEAGVSGHRENHSTMRKLGDRQGCFAARQHRVEFFLALETRFFYGVAGKLGWCGPMTLSISGRTARGLERERVSERESADVD
jgi:hypothetical protein